jgi:plastocyanin
MNARVLTPTLIICGAAAIGGGIALARPAAQASPPAAQASPPATAAPQSGSGYGRKPTATTTPRSGAPKGQAPSAGGASTAALTISGFAFGAPLTVSPGTKVAVSNRDSAPHAVSGSAFDTGTVAANASGAFTAPAAAGTYRFTCEIHPSMTGSLTVR